MVSRRSCTRMASGPASPVAQDVGCSRGESWPCPLIKYSMFPLLQCPVGSEGFETGADQCIATATAWDGGEG